MRPPPDDLLRSLEQATARYAQHIEEAAPQLAARGIDRDTAVYFRLGVVHDPIRGHEAHEGRLAIPSLGIRGPVAFRSRCLQSHDCKEHGCPKYMGIALAPTRIFNSRALHAAGDFIAITEGELDAVILHQCGIPAVAITGANGWKTHYPRVFAGYSTVYVCGDGDQAGQKFSSEICAEVLTAKAVEMDTGTDINDLYQAEGKASVRLRFDL